MRTRIKQTGQHWRTAETTVSSGKRQGHRRCIVTVTKRDGTKYTLEFGKGDAYKLADSIVDAIEGEA